MVDYVNNKKERLCQMTRRRVNMHCTANIQQKTSTIIKMRRKTTGKKQKTQLPILVSV